MENTKIQLEDLKPAEGATHKAKRKGRGRSSGMGKTSSRGHNGEGQRSGCSAKRGFEGGQMPAYRKVPKLKGFSAINPIKTAEIKVSDLAEYKIEEEVISLESLIINGILNPKYEALRVLGNGEISKAVKVKANHFSASAKAKIEAAGGTTEEI